MKIVLINPPLLEDFPSSSAYPPLGLLAVAAPFNGQNGFDVKIVDAVVRKLSVEEIVDAVITEQPDVVGITSMTAIFPSALAIARGLKSRGAKAKLVIGGPHATLMPEEVWATGAFDWIVVGEGDIVFSELCRAINDGRSYAAGGGSADQSLVLKPMAVAAGGVGAPAGGTNSPVEQNKNIIKAQVYRETDNLPFAAYNLLHMDAYQSRAPPGFIRKKPWISYCSSRSCPFDCRFCSTSRIWGRIWRGFSPERIVHDVSEILETYRIRSVFFIDDNFTMRRDRTMELCNKIIERGLKFEWACNCRVDQVDLELLKKMREAGCWRIGFGIEAGTQHMLDWYGKKITLEKARKAIKECKEVGISSVCYFIIGAPTETEDDIRATIKFAKEIDPDVVGFSYLTPFPGTRLFDETISYGWLLHDAGVQVTLNNSMDWSRFSQNTPMLKSQVPPERLVELSKMAYREFYFRPKYILRQVWTVRDPRVLIGGARNILKWITGQD